MDESFSALKSMGTVHALCNIQNRRFVNTSLTYVILINIYIKLRHATSLGVFVKNLSMWDEKCFLDLKSKVLWAESP